MKCSPSLEQTLSLFTWSSFAFCYLLFPFCYLTLFLCVGKINTNRKIALYLHKQNKTKQNNGSCTQTVTVETLRNAHRPLTPSTSKKKQYFLYQGTCTTRWFAAVCNSLIFYMLFFNTVVMICFQWNRLTSSWHLVCLLVFTTIWWLIMWNSITIKKFAAYPFS